MKNSLIKIVEVGINLNIALVIYNQYTFFKFFVVGNCKRIFNNIQCHLRNKLSNWHYGISPKWLEELPALVFIDLSKRKKRVCWFHIILLPRPYNYIAILRTTDYQIPLFTLKTC